MSTERTEKNISENNHHHDRRDEKNVSRYALIIDDSQLLNELHVRARLGMRGTAGCSINKGKSLILIYEKYQGFSHGWQVLT